MACTWGESLSWRQLHFRRLHALYAIVGLRLGCGQKKTYLVLTANSDLDDLPLLRDAVRNLLPDVVKGFKECMGVPRNPTSEGNFILNALEPVAARHDYLLELITDISEEDPFCGAKNLIGLRGQQVWQHPPCCTPKDIGGLLCPTGRCHLIGFRGHPRTTK